MVRPKKSVTPVPLRGALVGVFVIGCVAGEAMMASASTISPGDTKQEVLQAMGPPGDRQLNAEEEAWQYCRTGVSADQYVLIWISRGVVTGVTTYRNTTGAGNCAGFFRTVRWEDAPDAIIEVRER